MDVRELHRARVDMVRTWVQTGTRVEPTAYGFLARDLNHPLVRDSNLAWVDSPPDGGIDRLLHDLEAGFRGTRVRHRFVLFADASDAYDLQDAFVAATFRPRAELVMAKVGLPSCIVNPEVRVEEVGREVSEADYRLVTLALQAESGCSSEESHQVYEVERGRAAALGQAAFLGYVGKEPAATYTLRIRGPFGLVGDLAILSRFQMQGVGRTMIFDACRRATNARCEYVLSTTSLFDPPQEMYRTLGFEPVGELRGFLRPAL